MPCGGVRYRSVCYGPIWGVLQPYPLSSACALGAGSARGSLPPRRRLSPACLSVPPGACCFVGRLRGWAAGLSGCLSVSRLRCLLSAIPAGITSKTSTMFWELFVSVYPGKYRSRSSTTMAVRLSRLSSDARASRSASASVMRRSSRAGCAVYRAGAPGRFRPSRLLLCVTCNTSYTYYTGRN